ncbi:hypothetical protein OOZ63_24245 [Paucibacter sp. PLA-PC-4]|uniref:LPD7 domain-containing protein n=1 Tax=Paucibacter sp. PLA-PC-4 TaxID=2993655 RepID=UPI00224B9E9C|nr:LPD7 domain-containing protein [Paucibacter sp. PLA-PC-4]MCX2864947.1 hypothetical protein [Paucibacter sp. PLA-PC-4]
MTTRYDTPELADQSASSPTRPTAINGAAPDNARSEAAAKATSEAIADIDPQAKRSAMLARIELSLTERDIFKRAPMMVAAMKIGGAQHSFTEDDVKQDRSRLAFTESTLRWATDTNSASVGRSMVELVEVVEVVEVAQARNWRGLRVTGGEEFRRLIWLQASRRGMKAVGYEPKPADLEMPRRERETWQTRRIEAAREVGSSDASAPSEKPSARGGGHRSVLVAIEAILIAKKVPQARRQARRRAKRRAKRQAVLAAATQPLALSTTAAKIKVYDRSAGRHRPIPPLATDLKRTQDTAAATRIR